MGMIVITGAARGIGAACARALAGRAPLLIADLRSDALEQEAASLRTQGHEVETCVGDFVADGMVEALAQRAAEAGGCEGLVHAAGLSPEMGDARRIFEVNLFASATLVDALEPHLKPGAAGVLIASQAAELLAGGLSAEQEALLEAPFAADAYERLVDACGALASEPQGAYGLTKRGVQLLAISRAPAWGARGGRLVSLSPGIIDTDMGEIEFAAREATMQAIVDHTPVGGRRGRADEIAAVAAFLLSDAASFVSGSDILVDGGSTYQILRGPGLPG
ncbi:MAG: SDR family oxidoreductase [Deltaproteobacteria bacterium]|jgi:NAD(P)-dependent dehydrogenase (short-subunit alcohol dehydrogenase family)|nr:SDR family oxidoreductase [Deltaproteobacteria bacterium]